MTQYAIVTGSNGRTGQAICEALQTAGYIPVGLDVGKDGIGGFAYVQCDVMKLEQIVAAVDTIEAQHGPIGLVVNNAGVWHGKGFFDITPEDYDFTYGVNARGPFFLTQEVARRMIAAGRGGAVINVASIAGSAGGAVTDYAGSKSVVINFTKSISKPLGKHGIRVNAVSPGAINSAMGEKVPKELRDKFTAGAALGRAAEPHEIASVVAFLASPAAAYVTGATVDVNGGL
ncbi:MAG TPA: SDR family oxidoreductase [Ramlibacter sp.]|nr:SDR family oxidoreductase [Ramlibacter sp.]